MTTSPLHAEARALQRLLRAVAPVLLFAAQAGGQSLSGPFMLPGDTLVSIAEVDATTLRYRVFQNGLSASLKKCGPDEWCAGPDYSTSSPVTTRIRIRDAGKRLDWSGADGITRPLVALPITTRQAQFTSGNVALKGQLLVPSGAGPFPAVVFVHGSGRQSAIRTAFNPHFIVASGIAVLVFDKRGTGSSGGNFTMDFSALSSDVVAAVDWLKHQPAIDSGRIGLVGYSQGGWVAPLAATKTATVRYVAISYGMIDSPSEEERIQTLDRLRERGLVPSELAEADTLTRAAIRVVASGFREGWDSLARLDRRYHHRPWRSRLGGTTPGELLKYPRVVARLLGPRTAPPGLSWEYDSREALSRLSIPMAWFIAKEDRSAPNAFTLAELSRYREAGKPFEVIVFPGTDHGILEFRQAGFERHYTRYHPDYFMREAQELRRLAGLAGSPLRNR